MSVTSQNRKIKAFLAKQLGVVSKTRFA